MSSIPTWIGDVGNDETYGSAGANDTLSAYRKCRPLFFPLGVSCTFYEKGPLSLPLEHAGRLVLKLASELRYDPPLIAPPNVLS